MTTDATPAYRGYRLQHLYTLWYILKSSNQETITFQPEGQEDLDILDDNGTLLEVQQVKAYSDDLTLSTFSPEKHDSFFYRVAQLTQSTPHLKSCIVSFGNVGSELFRALEEDGADRRKVARKLSNYKWLSEEEAIKVLATIRLLLVKEADLTEQVFTMLRQSLTGVDPESAFDLLSFWLYQCAEQKRLLTRQDIIEKINRVGRFLSERAAHHREWFASITPIEDHSIEEIQVRLADSFFRGVAAEYDHILADLDVRRPQKLQEIERKFAEHNVVVVHGASGQGKSTLAYRYLREYFPSQWRFQVRMINGREHALSIALALSGHADAIGVPLAIYVDVSPRDNNWLDLIAQLSRHQNIRILITVREEDFRRATLSKAVLDLETLSLTFGRMEAEQIYYYLQEKQLSTQFLNFEDAWNVFGGEGPLMEFVYLVTQGETLRERLREQVQRLQDNVLEQRYPSDMLTLLRLVSTASAYEAQVKTKPLFASLKLFAPDRVLNLLEDEYLIRRSENGLLLQGLHPLRSQILVELLTDSPAIETWLESACTCLPFMYELDVESFLLYAFSRRRTECEQLLAFLSSYQTNQWTGIAGVTKALLWLGIREYAEANQLLIQEIVKEVGQGWYIILDSDITDAMSGSSQSLWKALSQNMTPEKALRLQTFQSRQSDKMPAFAYAKAWLSRQTLKPHPAVTNDDWMAMAEALFWLGHFEIQWPLDEWLSPFNIESALDTLPLDILASLVLGIWHAYEDYFPSWLENLRPRVLSRFQQETQCIKIDDDGTKLFAHFLIPFEFLETNSPQNKTSDNTLDHRLYLEAMQRISFLRRIFPEHEVYAIQGYGHRILQIPVMQDRTYKAGIPRSRMPVEYLTIANATFRGVAQRAMRPTTWQDYTQQVLQLRRTVLQALQKLEQGLEIYFRKQNTIRIFGPVIDEAHWTQCQKLLGFPPLLPTCALDEWGFVDEMDSKGTDDARFDRAKDNPTSSRRSSQRATRGLVFQHLNAFLDAFNTYTRTLSNFFGAGQAVLVMQINEALEKRINTREERMRLSKRIVSSGMNEDVFRLSTINLGDALQILSIFQVEFRRLLTQFCTQKEITELEGHEQRIFTRLWNIWYFFAFYPEKVMPNAVQECTERLRHKQKVVRKGIKRSFRLLEKESLQVNILTQTALWEKETVFWITVDAKNPIDAYNAGERVRDLLRKETHVVKDMLVRRYALDFPYTYACIVPLVQGKCLIAFAWQLFFPKLLVSDDEESQISLTPQILPSNVLSSLGIGVWTLSNIETTKQLWEKTVLLSFLTAHIGDIQRLPSIEENKSIEDLQRYIDQIFIRISDILQSLFNARDVLFDTWNALSQSEMDQRPNITQAIILLDEWEKLVVPMDDFQNNATIRLDQVVEWSQCLEKGRVLAFLIYFLDATDALDRK